MRATTIILSIALMAAAVGCGSTVNQEDEARTAAVRFLAAAKHDPSAACATLAPSARREIETLAASYTLRAWDKSCADALGEMPTFPEGPVARVVVDSTHATARLRLGTRLRLTSDGGRWRITSFGFEPLVPAGELPATAAARVAGAQVGISGYCVDYLSGSHHSSIDRYLRGIDVLIDVYRIAPDAVYRPGGTGRGLTMRQVLADQASALEKCGFPDDAAELDRVLAVG